MVLPFRVFFKHLQEGPGYCPLLLREARVGVHLKMLTQELYADVGVRDLLAVPQHKRSLALLGPSHIVYRLKTSLRYRII